MSVRKIIGIDIASGKGTSAIGYCILDEDAKIITFNYIAPNKNHCFNLLQDLHESFRYISSCHEVDLAVIEYTHFRNAIVNDNIQQAIGACAAAFNKVVLLQNTTLKKIVGGSGKASKEEMAKKMIKELKDEKLTKLYKSDNKYKWDVMDATALAWVGIDLLDNLLLKEELDNTEA